MKTTHVYFRATQIRQLKAIAKKIGVPMAAQIRMAVDEYITRRKAENGKDGSHGKEQTRR